jgi:hypothetical protein
VDGGLWTVDGGLWTVDGGQWTVDRGPWTDRGQCAMSGRGFAMAAGGWL